MKKSILLWLLAVAILAAGCAGPENGAQQTTASTTGAPVQTTTAATIAETQAETETTVATEPIAATETTSPEETQAQQTEPAVTNDELDDYMASLKAQSDAIKTSLEEDTLSQTEMNQKAQELYVLWDDALNDLWGKLRDSLPEDEFDELLDEQIQCIEDKENAVEEAGREYENGSLYPLVTNSEAADITEQRVYELYELLKQQ